jgi:adenylylsulfate kinase-like enzyme
MNEKNQVVLLYGMPASGKLTIASFLESEMGFAKIDNHYFHDFVRPFIGHGKDLPDEYFDKMEKLRRHFLDIVSCYYPCDRVAKYVFTNVLFDDPAGMATFRDIEEFARRISADFVPVELCCRPEVLKTRVQDIYRAARGKIASAEKLERIIIGRCTLGAMRANGIRIDTSDISAHEAFERVKEHVESLSAWSVPPQARQSPVRPPPARLSLPSWISVKLKLR